MRSSATTLSELARIRSRNTYRNPVKFGFLSAWTPTSSVNVETRPTIAFRTCCAKYHDGLPA